MPYQRFNTGKQALHFGQADINGGRSARHAKGKFYVAKVGDGPDPWKAWLVSIGQEQEIGHAATCGLAMSLCAQWLASH